MRFLTCPLQVCFLFLKKSFRIAIPASLKILVSLYGPPKKKKKFLVIIPSQSSQDQSHWLPFLWKGSLCLYCLDIDCISDIMDRHYGLYLLHYESYAVETLDYYLPQQSFFVCLSSNDSAQSLNSVSPAVNGRLKSLKGGCLCPLHAQFIVQS